jgi:hypothetical protein
VWPFLVVSRLLEYCVFLGRGRVLRDMLNMLVTFVCAIIH